MPDLESNVVESNGSNIAIHEYEESPHVTTDDEFRSSALRRAYGLESTGNPRHSRKSTRKSNNNRHAGGGSGEDQQNQLPSVHSAGGGYYSDGDATDGGEYGVHGGSGGANNGSASPRRTQTAPALTILSEIERLKNLTRDKDREVFRLKQEVGIMKQIERRQQRDIEQMQSIEEDAPRIIRLLRDELQSFKVSHLTLSYSLLLPLTPSYSFQPSLPPSSFSIAVEAETIQRHTDGR